MNNLVTFIIITFLEGIISLFFLLKIPADPKNAWLFGFSPERLFLIGGILGIDLILMWLAFQLITKSRWGQRIKDYADKLIDSPISLFLLLIALAIGSVLGGFFLGSWLVLGEKYQAIYQRLAPVVFFEAVFCIQLLFALRTRFRSAEQGQLLLNQKTTKFIERILTWLPPFILRYDPQPFLKKYKLHRVLPVVLFVFLAFIYLNLATNHGRTQNPDMQKTDQGAYLDFTQRVYESRFRYTGDRNRMPLYPFFQALFLNPAESEQDQFVHGKQVNIVLSLGLLTILGLIVSKFLTPRLTMNFVLIAAFALYIFKAGYYQSELLFYFLSFVSFLTMGVMVVSPSIILGLATGVFSALAQLTKASMLPMIAVFLGFYVLKVILNIWRMTKEEQSNRLIYIQQIKHHLVIFLCVVGSFLGVLYPYIRESKQVFGQYFYNVNSTFYIWYDSWEEAEQGTKAHNDREGWPDMPPEEIPGFQKYLHEHTFKQIEERLFKGVRKQFKILVNPYSHSNYLLIYSSFLVISSLVGLKKCFSLVKKNVVLTGFILTNFSVYFLLFSWYAAINEGARFILSLFLPMLFALMVALKHLFNQYGTNKANNFPFQAFTLLDFVNGIVMVLILVDLAYFVPIELANHYFGG